VSQDNPNLRSQDWFGGESKTSFIHRSWMKIEGIPDHEFNGKPVVGICNTWSKLCETQNCNTQV
jgi:dihydroxyacid dehydratase/phosphogluconate dehydratase